jgi:N-carbamoylputrescine amidase
MTANPKKMNCHKQGGRVTEMAIKLALIQMTCGADVKENYSKAVDLVRRAASQGANIVCTQELFKSRYFPQVEDSRLFKLAEKIDGKNPTVQELSALAKQLEIVLIASLFEKRAMGLYHNTAIVIDADGRLLGKYRKMHIPDDPLYYEKFFFTPGDLGYPVFRTKFADISVLICWDQWFPEAARLCAMRGAKIILYPTAIGFSRPEKELEGAAYRDSWQTVQRGHAIANACFVATVNRVGFEQNPAGEGGIDFWGQSFVADPSGQLVKKAADDKEEALVCPIDLDLVREIRESYSFPFRDRRIDSYHGLTKLYLDSES